MKIPLAIVPVAGLGTRLLPATKSQPKEMLPVAKKPVVQYVVEELGGNGVEQILFITGKNKTSIEDHFDAAQELSRNLQSRGKKKLLAELEFEFMPLQFFFTRQREQKGLGDAILCGHFFTRDAPFVVALGDSIIGLHGHSGVVRRMAQVFAAQRADCVIAVEEVPIETVSSYGVVSPGRELGGGAFVIGDLVEKPAPAEAPSNLAIAARYVFSSAIYAALGKTLPGKGGEIQLTDAIRILLEDGGKIIGIRLGAGEKRYDIGNFQSYFEAFIEFAIAECPELKKLL